MPIPDITTGGDDGQFHLATAEQLSDISEDGLTTEEVVEQADEGGATGLVIDEWLSTDDTEVVDDDGGGSAGVDPAAVADELDLGPATTDSQGQTVVPMGSGSGVPPEYVAGGAGLLVLLAFGVVMLG